MLILSDTEKYIRDVECRTYSSHSLSYLVEAGSNLSQVDLEFLPLSFVCLVSGSAGC